MKNTLVLLLNLLCLSSTLKAKNVQMSAIGDLHLVSGQVLTNCQLGYQTFGSLNKEKSNSILFPTWFMGTSSDIATEIKPWRFIDTSRFFLILADALGNGISSSPSNSKDQPGAMFPKITIEDMVNAHHQLLVNQFGLQHLYAVIGYSMGAFQSYQWAVSYPDFADHIIPIAGTPQLTSYDLITYNMVIMEIEENADYNHGRYTKNPNIPIAMLLMTLDAYTPLNIDKTISVKDASRIINSLKTNSPFDWNDFHSQLLAVLTQDITRKYHNSMAETGKHINAKFLIINNHQDHLVSPIPSSEFSKYISAKLIIIDNDQGHNGYFSDAGAMDQVKDFLTNP